MKIVNLFCAIVALTTLIMSTGCMSVWSYSSSKKEILRERIYASGNQNAINLVANGVDEETAIKAVPIKNGIGIGVDVSNLRILAKHPFRQIGAAALDALTAYGSYRAVQSLNAEGNSQEAGRDNNTVSIHGNGNNVGIGNTTTEIPVIAGE